MNKNYTELAKIMNSKVMELYATGLSNVDIAKALDCNVNTVWRHLKKNGILRIFTIDNTSIDWAHLQSLYDSGLSEKELKEQKIVSRTQLTHAKNNGIFVPRTDAEIRKLARTKTPIQVHSDEFKKQQSMRMTQRHKEGLAYTLGHNERYKQRSYPEQWFETVIKSNLTNQNFTPQYREGRYSLDFAWPDSKKYVEVDGETHYRFEEERIKDIKRTEWLAERGWTILRFRWKTVVSNKQQAINDLKKFIDGEVSVSG